MAAGERTLKAEGVILRHQDYGEADRILTVYTRDQGKLRLLAKGVRRLRSRKAGHLEPFTRARLLLARGKEMWLVTQADTVEAFLPLREDLVKTGYAAYALELVDRFTYDEGANREIYTLLVSTLERISTSEDGFLPVRYHEIRLLDLVGFRPELFQCVRCGRQILAEDQYFSAELGGALCPRCGYDQAATYPISMPALKYFRHLQRSTYAEALRAQITPAIRAEMERLIYFYITYILERGLNAPEFLKQIRPSGS